MNNFLNTGHGVSDKMSTFIVYYHLIFIADIDECAGGIDACDTDNGICQNTIGSYACKCNEGFNMSPGDDKTCERKYRN